MSRKYILTVQISDRSGDAVENVLLQIAQRFQGRLTRSDFEPAGASGFIRRTGGRTLRKLGPSGK